ncbi:hypothetical protein JTB14_034858 [Gonioctena quinquepunctata]|nr:hypothetical protein JTB14_034858 [Gonioctena quinquepunctata]
MKSVICSELRIRFGSSKPVIRDGGGDHSGEITGVELLVASSSLGLTLGMAATSGLFMASDGNPSGAFAKSDLSYDFENLPFPKKWILANDLCYRDDLGKTSVSEVPIMVGYSEDIDEYRQEQG